MSDERPKPKYGELAPEGWSWKPPQQEEPESEATPASAAAVANPAPPASPAAPIAGTPDPGAPGPATPKNRSGDRIATILLLAAGLLATVNMVSSFLVLPDVMNEFMQMQGISGTYGADAQASSAGAVGATVLVVIFALTLVWSIQRMRAQKLSFFVPLIGAALSFATNLVVVLVALLADPSILGSVQP
ncbi:DUF6264 family protein [Herbiconiux moechotypicola]|uniref:Uncharacterized protein n=1 Tax=Herbiconiux moechotypicola TaxID=637393 RepID=A0ABN3DMK7_9MICO|nr:DUF6264 family protein [Herbiconiux moechotypicola]MCS5730271.1 DUF6264 family protein [Herbiconiux moechotypicola]